MAGGYRSVAGLGLLASFIMVLAVSIGMAPAEQVGVLGGLRPGLPITLTEAQGRFEIGIVPGIPGPLGHEVTAVGDDYVAVKDVAGVTETVIPLFSIKCVKTLRQPR